MTSLKNEKKKQKKILGGGGGRGGYEIEDKINMRRTSYAGEASSRSCLPSGESYTTKQNIKKLLFG